MSARGCATPQQLGVADTHAGQHLLEALPELGILAGHGDHQVAEAGLVGALLEGLQVGQHQPTQRSIGWLVGVQLGVPARLQGRELGLEDVVEQRLLGPVMEINAALAEAGLPGDIQEPCRREAAANEAPRRCSPDLLLALLIWFDACRHC